jgi:hypothetical protein
MIGKPFRERYAPGPLAPERAIAVLTEMLASQGKLLVEVRAQGPGMIACLIVRADKTSIRLCRALGFRVKLGGTGVFGLEGPDAHRLVPDATPEQRAWLETPCGPRETKVVLVSGGIALLSIETNDGRVAINAAP